jgi:hypothetical protein
MTVIKNNLNALNKRVDLLVEKQDDMIRYIDYLGSLLDDYIQYNKYTTDTVISFKDFLKIKETSTDLETDVNIFIRNKKISTIINN